MTTVIRVAVSKDPVKKEITSSLITVRQRNNNILHMRFEYPKEKDRKLLYKIYKRYSDNFNDEDRMDLFAHVFCDDSTNENIRKILAEGMKIDLADDDEPYTLTREILRFNCTGGSVESKEDYDEAIMQRCPLYALVICKKNCRFKKLPTELVRVLKDFLYY